MSEPIVYIDKSEIRAGKLEELKLAIKDLVDFVDANEARPAAYNIYFNEEDSQMTVVQVHPDSASLEFHLEIAGAAFPTFKGLIRLSTIEIYGKPSNKLRTQLKHKAEMLGSGTVAVHILQAGFIRFRTDGALIQTESQASTPPSA